MTLEIHGILIQATGPEQLNRQPFQNRYTMPPAMWHVNGIIFRQCISQKRKSDGHDKTCPSTDQIMQIS